MRQDEMVPAYVIQARPWRETSLLYKVIAYHHGRISLIHRGARNSRRTLRCRTDPGAGPGGPQP